MQALLGNLMKGGGGEEEKEIGARNTGVVRSSNRMPVYNEKLPALQGYREWGACVPEKKLVLQMKTDRNYKDLLDKVIKYSENLTLKNVFDHLLKDNKKELLQPDDSSDMEDDEDLGITNLNRLLAVEGNSEVTFYLTEDGRLYCSGKSSYGLLGRAEEKDLDDVDLESCTRNIFRVPVNDRVRDIKVGRRHALALTARGDVYAWGQNNAG